MKILLIFLCLTPAVTFSQENWNLKRDQNGIKVYMQEIEGSPFKEILVHLKCQITLKEFENFIVDEKNHVLWMQNVNEFKIVEQMNPYERVYYVEFNLPWPASNRDLNNHFKVIPDSIPGKIFISVNSIEGYVPEKEGNVRVAYSRAFWEVNAINEKEIEIEYSIRLDPAGSLPPWLVNLTASNGPYNSFVALKEILEQHH